MMYEEETKCEANPGCKIAEKLNADLNYFALSCGFVTVSYVQMAPEWELVCWWLNEASV